MIECGERVRKWAEKEERQAVETVLRKIKELRRAGDIVGALAVYDAAPLELRKHVMLANRRASILEQLRKSAVAHKKKAIKARHPAVRVVIRAVQRCVGTVTFAALFRSPWRLSDIGGRRWVALKRPRFAADVGSPLATCATLPPELPDDRQILRERGSQLVLLGQLDAAYDVYRKLLAIDRKRTAAWKETALIMQMLNRKSELPEFIGDMLAALPCTSETLMEASWIAKSGNAHDLAQDLLEKALSPPMNPSPTMVLKAARTLLTQGEEGQVIALLDKHQLASKAKFEHLACDLRDRALGRMRLAGRQSASGPIGERERADVIAVQSILQQAGTAGASYKPQQGAIAIAMGSLGPGGIQKQVLQLVRQLRCADNGSDRLILLILATRSKLAPDFYKEKFEGLSISIVTIDDTDSAMGSPTAIENRLGVLSQKTAERTAYMAYHLRVHRPEVVLAMSDRVGIPAMLAAAIVGVPRVVVSFRGLPPPPGGSSDKLFKPAFRTALAHNGVALTANSRATALDHANWLGLPSASVRAIYNGVDVDRLLSERDPAITAQHRRSLGIANGARVIGSVFNYRKEKRPELWIESAAIIARRAPDVVFVIIGGGFSKDEASTKLSRHGLEGRFYTPGLRQDVPNWLDLMDVFLLTSIVEGTPNVLLEAQTLGRPVVATAAGGNAETFLPEQTGVLLSANPTAEEIADQVMRVLDDPGFTTRAREQGPAFIRQRFSVERMASDFVDILFCGSTSWSTDQGHRRFQ